MQNDLQLRGSYESSPPCTVDPDLAAPVSVKSALKVWLKSPRKVRGRYLYKMAIAVDLYVAAPVSVKRKSVAKEP